MLWLWIAGLVMVVMIGWDMQQLHNRISALESQIAELKNR
jgi:polyhydroxyalkanoate synthesis regulator phasin